MAIPRPLLRWIRSTRAHGRPRSYYSCLHASHRRRLPWQHRPTISISSRISTTRARRGSSQKRSRLDAQPTDGDDTNYKVIVVVFTDLPADRAQALFDDVLQQLAVPSYVEDGILFGPFYEGNKGTAIYNSGFRPFQSPVPFLFVRHGVISDWKFFLDNEDWLNRWAHRYGESAVRALAEELRRLPWRAGGDQPHNK